MTTFLVDSNVLLDVVTDDPSWADWSQTKLDTAARAGDLVINPVIYAEVSLAFAAIEDLDAGLASVGLMCSKYHVRRYSSLPRRFACTVGAVGHEHWCCPISSSARTRLSTG